MHLDEIRQLQNLIRNKDWTSAHALLDGVCHRAATSDDIRSESDWRVTVLAAEQRYEEALGLLRATKASSNCKCLVQHNAARLLFKLGREPEALEELKNAPIEEEMENFYGLAIDAKFFYFYLLAKNGDPSVKDRLSEIPDDYPSYYDGWEILDQDRYCIFAQLICAKRLELR